MITYFRQKNNDFFNLLECPLVSYEDSNNEISIWAVTNKGKSTSGEILLHYICVYSDSKSYEIGNFYIGLDESSLSNFKPFKGRLVFEN